MRKVRTEENLADALTKYVSQEEINYHIQHTNQLVSEGRHELAPEIGSIERQSISRITDTCNLPSKQTIIRCTDIDDFPVQPRPLICDRMHRESTMHASGQSVRGGVQRYSITITDTLPSLACTNYRYAGRHHCGSRPAFVDKVSDGGARFYRAWNWFPCYQNTLSKSPISREQ